MSSRKDKEYSDIHKATFPTAFAQFFVENFSSSSVIDPFGGSGTTIIACEKTGRKCFMMELDPIYVDVIIERWETFTGGSAIKL
jgi:DNA modification methylase